MGACDKYNIYFDYKSFDIKNTFVYVLHEALKG